VLDDEGEVEAIDRDGPEDLGLAAEVGAARATLERGLERGAEVVAVGARDEVVVATEAVVRGSSEDLGTDGAGTVPGFLLVPA
jgi:hypothetical protein